jgi:hypothetical protein
MNAKLWTFLALMSMVLVSFYVQAEDQCEKKRDDPQQEVRELKRLVLELTARLEKIERRLSQLEKPREQPAQATTGMVPLGSHLMVDRHGIIWDEGRPVGTWGVNGSEPPGLPTPPAR